MPDLDHLRPTQEGTPRTDAEEYQAIRNTNSALLASDDLPVVRVEFAQELERELSEAQAALEAMREEKDRAKATNRYYEQALYFPGIRPYAVQDGDDAVEIKPERIVEIVAALARKQGVIKELVRLQDLKERYEALDDPMQWKTQPELASMAAEHNRCWPLAIAAARAEEGGA